MRAIIRPVFMIMVLTVFALEAPCLGQSYKKLGVAGMKFLDIDASARSAALGGASSSLLDGPTSLFQNPAGLVEVANFGFSASTNNWIADIKQHCFGAAIAMDKIGFGWLGGVLGVSMRYMDNGDMVRTDVVNVEGDMYYEYPEPYRIEEWAAGLGYARRITDHFLLGGHVRYAVQDFGTVQIRNDLGTDTLASTNKLTPWVLDVGTIYYTGLGDLRVSMSYHNFSEEMIYVRDRFELPISLKVGIAMTVLSLREDTHSLLVAADISHPRDYAERINLGLEYQWGGLAVRTGYKYDLRFRPGHDEEGLSAGFGLHLGSLLTIDYAYTVFGVFGSVQRLSVVFST